MLHRIVSPNLKLNNQHISILQYYPNRSLFAQRTKVFTLLTHNGIIRAEHLIITYQQSIFYAASDEKQKWRKTQRVTA